VTKYSLRRHVTSHDHAHVHINNCDHDAIPLLLLREDNSNRPTDLSENGEVADAVIAYLNLDRLASDL
jgi:hypothetical protein